MKNKTLALLTTFGLLVAFTPKAQAHPHHHHHGVCGVHLATGIVNLVGALFRPSVPVVVSPVDSAVVVDPVVPAVVVPRYSYYHPRYYYPRPIYRHPTYSRPAYRHPTHSRPAYRPPVNHGSHRSQVPVRGGRGGRGGR